MAEAPHMRISILGAADAELALRRVVRAMERCKQAYGELARAAEVAKEKLAAIGVKLEEGKNGDR